MSELERELFGKVYIIDYYTTALKIKGFEHIPMGFYYFAEFMDDPTSIGNPVAMQKFYADTDIFLFWSYGNSTNIKGEEIIEFARNAVASMGGEVVKTILQRRFRYFPHIKSQGILKFKAVLTFKPQCMNMNIHIYFEDEFKYIYFGLQI